MRTRNGRITRALPAFSGIVLVCAMVLISASPVHAATPAYGVDEDSGAHLVAAHFPPETATAGHPLRLSVEYVSSCVASVPNVTTVFYACRSVIAIAQGTSSDGTAWSQWSAADGLRRNAGVLELEIDGHRISGPTFSYTLQVEQATWDCGLIGSSCHVTSRRSVDLGEHHVNVLDRD